MLMPPLVVLVIVPKFWMLLLPEGEPPGMLMPVTALRLAVPAPNEPLMLWVIAPPELSEIVLK